MTIIISKKGEQTTKIENSSFENEAHIQKYINDNPASIPIYEIDEDLKLLIIAREFPTSSGPLDALGIDQYGNLYVIETKLYDNPDKRKVLAQIMDYGAALWSEQNSDNFIEKLENKVQVQFGISLMEKLSQFYNT